MAADISVTSEHYILSANKFITLWASDDSGEDTIEENIPSVIRNLIKMFLPNYKIYGIGWNYNGLVGYGVPKHLPRYQLLSELSKICDNPFSGLLLGNSSLFVCNSAYRCLMIAGNNVHGQCGINSNKKTIDTFTNVTDFILSKEENSYSEDWVVLKYIVCLKIFSMNILIDNQNQRLFTSGWSFDDIKIYFHGGKMPSKQENIFFEMQTNLFSLSFLSNNPFQHKTKVQQMIFLNSGMLLCLMNTGEVYCTYENITQHNISTNNNKSNNNIHKYPFLNFTLFFTSTEFRNKRFLKIVAGRNHVLWLDESRQLFVSGGNKYGQLGLGYSPSIAYLKNVAVDATFNIKYNAFFEENIIRSIDCGSSHSAVLLENGNVYLFGDNYKGQIGNGSAENMEGRKPVCTPFLLQSWAKLRDIRVKQISLGLQHTCILTEDHELYACGWNVFQQVCDDEEIIWIRHPRLVTREEIGISPQDEIVRVVACNYQTLVVINLK